MWSIFSGGCAGKFAGVFGTQMEASWELLGSTWRPEVVRNLAVDFGIEFGVEKWRPKAAKERPKDR